MANGGNINYNVRFNADTSGLNKATQEIQKIQDSLKAVRTINIRAAMAGKAPEEAAKLKQELIEAKEAASLVESALKKSFNTKLDTFNITNFKNELTKAGTSISEIGQKLMKSGAKGAAAFRDIETQVGKVNLKVKQSNKLLDEMATTMMNSIKWGVTSSIWNNMTGSIEKAWGFAKKLDSSLNDIRIVTEKSAEDMEKFAVQANKAAKTLGSSTTGYTEASLIYYQQGLSDAEVQARTETTLKAANVTGQSAAEVSEQLTAVWNGYKVSAQEAELYVDKLSAVAATTAADLEELSTGMSKVASAASIMGVDIDQLNAQLATVVSVTRQAPESVGTAFKTIYARMGDIEAGLDTETSLGEYTKKMSEMGFNVLDTNGKLRDMGSVIEEIGNKWTGLSREQQVALSQTMAGTRQYNNLLALFDNWDEYTKSLETSRDAAGSLQKQQDIYMESMEAHLQKLSTEGERIYNNLFNADTVNPLIDALTSLVSLIADFIDGIGGIGPLLLMIGSMGTKALSKQIGEGLATSITNFRNAKKNAEELASQYQLLDSISKDFSNDLVGQQAKIDKSINSLARKGLITQERADELRSFSAALGETGKRIDNLKIKQEEYNKVAKEGKDNAQQLDKDAQDQSNYTSTATLLEQISTQRKTVEIDDNTQLKDAIPAYRALNEELDRRNEKLDQTREKLDQTNISLKQNIANNQSLANIISQQGDISKAYQSPDFQHQVGNINKNIKDIQKQYEAFEKDLSEKEKANFKGALSSYQEHLQKLREAGSAGTLTSEQIKKFQEYAIEVQQEFEKAITNGFNDGLENAEAAIENIRQAAQQAAEGTVEQNQKDLTSAEEEAQGLQQDFNDEIANEQLKQRITLMTELAGAIGQVASAMQMVSSIVNVVMDDSLSTEEKIKQIIPLLVAAVPMLLSGLNSAKASLAGLFPSGMAAAGGLTATATASTAAGAAATGAAGGFTALWGAIWPIGAVVLGLVVAVGALTAIVKAATDAYNADAIAAEKAAEAAKEAANAAVEAKTAYEELANTMAEYDSAVDSLKELTKGTDEYTEALNKANAQAIELISTNALLADRVSRNAEGLLVFDENAKEEVLATARKRANQAQATSYLAQAQAGIAKNKSEITNLGRKLVVEYTRPDGSNKQITAESVLPDIIKAIQEKGSGLTKEEISSIKGIDTRLIPVIEENMSEIVKQTNATNALKKTNDLLKDEIIRASLDNNEKFTNKTEAEKAAITAIYGEGMQLDPESDAYKELVKQAEDKYKDYVDIYKNDADMQKEYAQKRGYTHIAEGGPGEGRYMDSEGNEVKIADDVARTWLKQQYIAEELAKYDETKLESTISMVEGVSAATKQFSQGTQAEILNILTGKNTFNTTNVSKADFDKLQLMSTDQLAQMFANVGDDFNVLGENGAQEFIKRLQFGLEHLDWSGYYNNLLENAKKSLETINKALDNFKLGELLDEETIKELEQKFPELANIQDKASQKYLERLISIREELERVQVDSAENLRNLTIDKVQKLKFSADLDESEFKKQLKQIAEQDYQVVVAIKADVQSDFDSVTNTMENLNDISAKIGDNFIVAAEDIEELNDAFPGILAGIQFLENGTVQLNEDAVNAAMEAAQREASADTYTTIQKLENQKIVLAEKRDAAYQMADIATKLANGELKLTDVQSELNTNLNILKTKNNEETARVEQTNEQKVAKQASISAESMTQNFANAYQAMAADSQKFAEIAKKNFLVATSGQGDTISSWGENFNTAWKATNTAFGTVATTPAEKFMTMEDLTNEGVDYKQVAEAFKQLGDAFNESYNNITGKQAELLARSQDLFHKTTQIGSGNREIIDLLEDEINRYHDINILLDDMAKKIERVNRAQEHLVGADWLAVQEQGLKLLEEEIELRRQKQEIQQAEAVELQGHLLADGVKFFDDGSVANYAEIMIAQLAKANQAKMSGNEDVADAAEKNYEAFKENFERYEELRDEIEDLADEITDMMYEQISKKVEAFTAKLTVELDTTQAQKEWKEFTNQLFISANNALAQITAQSEIYSANRNIATQTTGKYEQIVNEGIKAQSLVEGTAEEGTTSVYAQWSEELQQYIFDQAKWQEDMQASQQEAQEAILQILDDVDALGATAIGLLEDTIAAQKEQLAIYDDMNSLLNHSLKLQELFTGEKDYDAKGRFYAEQATISDQKARDAAARRNYALSNIDTYAQAYNEAKQKYDEAVANGTGDVTVLEKQLEITKQAYEDMKNELKESTDDFYSSIEEQIEAAKNVYVNTINKAMADMEKMFTGGKGLSYINEEWDLINKNAERYLDTVNSTYEVQALESKYIKAMDSTSNLSAQKKINKAMEEELKALREKDKLSQYDIDRANKKYELTMKQIALEEAQANKSTMRLRRDAQGNYSYQFVADENKVSDAQQDLLAAQNDLYNFDKERYQQTLDDILSIYQEYQQKMLEAAQINDPIARAEQEKLITEQYQQLMLAIAADNETAKQNLGMSTTEALQGQYDINRSNFEAITQGIFDNFSSVEEGMSTNFEMIMSNMITGWSGGVQSMIDKIAGDGPDGFKQQSQNAFNIAQQAAQEFDNKLIEIGENFSGEGNTADRILSDVQDINNKLDSFKTNVLDPTLAAVQELIPDVWTEYKSGVDLAAESMNTLATKISSVYTNADSLSKKLTNIASQSPINVEVKYKTTGDATNPSGGYVPSGDSGTGGGISTDTPTPAKTGLLEVGNELIWMGGKDYPRKTVHSTDLAEGAELPEDKRWKITTVWARTESWGDPWYNIQSGDIKASIPDYAIDKSTMSFDTGGYTGEWGSEGRMAMLHEKEIVLNQTDTANILDAVAIVRGIGDMLASLQSNWLSNLSSVQVPTISNSETNNSTAQTVNITAEFPNASSATEIEKALKNLVNIASQRAQAFK